MCVLTAPCCMATEDPCCRWSWLSLFLLHFSVREHDWKHCAASTHIDAECYTKFKRATGSAHVVIECSVRHSVLWNQDPRRADLVHEIFKTTLATKLISTSSNWMFKLVMIKNQVGKHDKYHKIYKNTLLFIADCIIISAGDLPRLSILQLPTNFPVGFNYYCTGVTCIDS